MHFTPAELQRFVLHFPSHLQSIALAEKYLVHVWAGVRSNTTADTFDQLRLENFIKGVAIDNLPPTSSVIWGHIHRGAYQIRKSCNILEKEARERLDDPLENGWVELFGMLVPAKCMKALPDKVLKLCKCDGKCKTNRCSCKSAGVKCTIYCHGKGIQSSCMNTGNRL